jgi:hypothetical protein
MKKCVISIVLSIAIVMCGLITVSANDISTEKSNILAVNLDANKSSDNQIKQSAMSKLAANNNTVIFYGRNLDIEKINSTYLSDVKTPKLSESRQSSTNDLVSIDHNITETYAVLVKQYNGIYSISYESATYVPEAKVDMESYFNEVLSTKNINGLAQEFINRDVTENVAMVAAAPSGSYIAGDIQDNNTFVLLVATIIVSVILLLVPKEEK